MLSIIKKIISNKKGALGVGTVLITVMIIILVIFPTTAFLFEQARMGAIVGDVRKAIDSSVVESYRSLQAPYLSQEEFRADNGLFQFYVEERLKSSLNLAMDYTPQEGSILSGPLTVNSLIFVGSNSLPYTDLSTGKVYNRPFVEINFTVRIKPMLYVSIITDTLGVEYKEITSTRKVTLPINN
jgi:hypothetical protein